jgi:hypothetical protein
MADEVAAGHRISLIHIANMAAILHHSLGFMAFPFVSQKLPSAGASRTFINM